ncbi:peptidyl-prolyl cis-trans isomerase-like 4 [Striga asiatica]|uniref:Peptidyl-prolyl cis-trans isomerase-like 4 n=1 Tax=Striga asiatica TaxID=4170 RepID=A0A5A7Q0G4_STRAF|nr:peptidyl-prolyl cis-trans isomerase-like 4 [Striga asiatica]
MLRLTIVGFDHRLVLTSVLILLAMMESFSHARQVKEVRTSIVMHDEKALAEADPKNLYVFRKVNLHQPVLNQADMDRTFARIGRKMKSEKIETRKSSENGMAKFEEQKSNKGCKKVRMEAHTLGDHSRKENWREYNKAFSSDYRTPKPHPPKNN